MDSTPTSVADALLALLAVDRAWVKGTALCLKVDSPSSRYEFEAWPRRGKWKTRSLETGERRSYDAGTQLMRIDEDETPRASYPFFPVHDSVKLLFPLELPIWGRSRDDYRPVSADTDGERTILICRHKHDAAVIGTLTIDARHGHATDWISPMNSIRYLDLPDRSTSFGFVAGAGQ
jgi:hypothetical protein